MKSRILAAATLGLALVCPTAYAQTTTAPATPAVTPEASAPAPEATLDSVLAEVNGVTLTLGELIALRRELPPQYQDLPDDLLFNGLTEQIIDQMLMAEAAVAAGHDQILTVKLNLRLQQRAILADAYLTRAIAARVTDEAIAALYQERHVDAPMEQEVRAGHILVDSLEKATAIKAEIDGGADFAALAAVHGTDGTAQRGGDLGWFAHGEMVPEFADAAFAMEPGTISDPVQSQFGWHLIKLEERRDRPAPALDEVRAALVGELTQLAQVAIVAELREKATLVMPDPKLPAASVRADALLEAAE